MRNEEDRKKLRKLSVAQLQKMYEDALKEALIAKIERIPSEVEEIVKASINGILLNAIGMEKSYDGWRVDHCNGRRTAIGNEIGERARAQVEQLIPESMETILRTLTTKTVKEAIKEEWKEQVYKATCKYLAARAEDEARKAVGVALAAPATEATEDTEEDTE